MGGKALKNTITERKSTDEFNRIASILQKRFSDKLNVETYIVKCYHEKETHGDLDILLKVDNNFHNKGINIKNWIKDEFNPNEIFYNGNVSSFDFDQFQIDIIPVGESDWKLTKIWTAYDPTGNLMGKIANSMRYVDDVDDVELKVKLCYSPHGLYAKIYSKDADLKEILLSKNPDKIFEFLGYDYKIFEKGFDKLIEIFNYTISSKYFCADIFQFENLNHVDRKRNRKRKTFNEFLEYIKTLDNKNIFPFKYNKELVLNHINLHFPEVDFESKVNKAKELYLYKKELSKKFNGNLVMKWFPELKGKELGLVLFNYKKSKDNFQYFIENNDCHSIEIDFKNYYKSNICTI
jgi:hypothetical protein